MRLSIFMAVLFTVSTRLSHAGIDTAAGTNQQHLTQKETSTPGYIVLPSEPDYEEEKLRFQRGAEPYYGLPQYGIHALNGQNTLSGNHLLKMARKGNAEAQYQLGIRYLHGQRMTHNDVQAYQWFLKAAVQSHRGAQVFLGMMSEQGRGMAQDYAKARQWYEKAAADDFADAQFMLGLMYFQGKGGIPQDVLAHGWFQKAAAQQQLPAQVNLGWMCEYGRGVEQNYTCAQRWYKNAAEQGDILAQYNLGNLYYLGKGVAQDYAQAQFWFHKAAERNHVPAQYNLGVMALGQGRKKDALEAYQWFRLVKLARYPGATENIAKAAAELTPQQIAQADAWVRQWTMAHSSR